MVVAFDAFSRGESANSPSFTHTPVGTPRAAIVLVVQESGQDAVSGVTYGSAEMTEVTGSPFIKSSGEAATIYAYFLGSGIPTGAQTVDVTSIAVTYKVAGCITLTAAANCSVVNTASISSDSLENPSTTLSLTGRTSFCALGFNSGHLATSEVTPLANWNAREELDFGSNVGGVYTYDTIGSTDVTVGWTQTAEDATMFAVAISEVAGGTSPPGGGGPGRGRGRGGGNGGGNGNGGGLGGGGGSNKRDGGAFRKGRWRI